MRRTISTLILLGPLLGWWLVAGPVALGGPATYAVVDGRSMEPTYSHGDLVVARTAERYGIGDVVVFPAADRKVVIHRIVDGTAEEGWITRGDNNDVDDRWILPDDAILGRQWVHFPSIGRALLWTQQNPWMFAVAAGITVLGLTMLARRPPAVHPILAEAMAQGRRLRLREERPLELMLLVVVARLAAVTAVISLVLLWSAGLLLSPAGAVAFAILALSALFAHLLERRIVQGRGLAEPDHSRSVLAERCWIVAELPAVASTKEMPSAGAFRKFLDEHRLPVLRWSSPEGDVYLTISAEAQGHPHRRGADSSGGRRSGRPSRSSRLDPDHAGSDRSPE